MIRLEWQEAHSDADMVRDEHGQIAQDDGLATSVIISLFTDARAPDTVTPPAGDSDRRGWWADAYGEIEGDEIGSLIWIETEAAKMTQGLPLRVQEAATRALRWMIEDGVARETRVQTEKLRSDLIALHVDIGRPNGTRWQRTWEAKLGMAAA